MKKYRFYSFKAVVVVFSITYSCSTYADLFAPKNYDDCILDGMKGVGSDVASG